MKRRGENVDPQTFGEQRCVKAIAAGKSQKKLIECETPEQVITPEESCDSLGDPADRIVAHGGSVLLIELIKFDHAKRDEAE